MIQPQSLKVTDPLANKVVTIVIKILPTANDGQSSGVSPEESLAPRSAAPSLDKPVTIAIGLENEVPIFVSGSLTELDSLVTTGWQAFGRHYQGNGSNVPSEEVAAQTLSIPDTSAVEQDPNQTKKSNLSLF